MALTDPLTGLYNQRYLMRHLRGLLAATPGSRISVLMLDADHFKRVNDVYGHAAGDRALQLIAGALRGRTRVFDSLARYGGEEFVAVMPGSDPDDALAAAERLRTAIAELHFEPEPGTTHPLTVSIGVASSEGRETTPEALLHAADQALYAAKRGGRNCVVQAKEA
jgi:two-component system cell cycle response regulator